MNTRTMSDPILTCPKCRAPITDPALFNQPAWTSCRHCSTPVRVEIFPALFKPAVTGNPGQPILGEGESGCFYHPQRKAVVPCDACGRFLCALCDCEIHGKHFCPACLELSQQKKPVQGIENSRGVHGRLALLLALLPFLVTGIIAIFIAIRYRKEPGSLVKPMRWAFPLALVLASLQVLILIGAILFPVFNR